MTKKLENVSWIQIITNVVLLLMLALAFLGLAVREDAGLSDISQGLRAQVNQICIDGDWEECQSFGEKELIEIKMRGDRSTDGEMTLYIRKVK